jgi:uncharacterized membrane protein YphA (DoxX/SURF4 family)
MPHWKGHTWLGLAARLYIGGVFLYACFHKILHPERFAMDVATYDILPLFLVNGFAITLPWIELAAGLLIISGYGVKPGALLLTGMMAMFVVALAIALSKGLDMACGCFASTEAEEAISIKTLFRDLLWLLLCLYILIFDNKPARPFPASRRM